MFDYGFLTNGYVVIYVFMGFFVYVNSI